MGTIRWSNAHPVSFSQFIQVSTMVVGKKYVTQKEAREAVIKCGSIRKAIKYLGITKHRFYSAYHKAAYDSIVSGCTTNSEKPVTADVPVADKSQFLVGMGTLRRAYEAEKQLRKDIQEAFETYKAANDFILSLSKDFVSPTIIVPSTAKEHSESLACMFNADWHAFETVKPNEVNGLNEYNPVICRQSAEASIRFFVKQTTACRNITTINDAMICYLGDLMSGHLWPDQIEGNAGSPLEEALFVVDLIIGQLTYALNHGGFKNIYVFTVDGNHSRITDKKRKTNRAHHSLEWLIFQFVQRYFVQLGEKRISFRIGDGVHNYAHIAYGVDKRHPNGLVWRLTHGDEGISYKGGVGGISIPANRQIRQWNEGYKADLTIFGHLHTAEANLKRYLAVASMIGMTPNGLRFEYEPPTQAMLTVEKTRGITGYYPIFVR